MDTREGKDDIASNVVVEAVPLVPCRSFAWLSYLVCPVLALLGAFCGGPSFERSAGGLLSRSSSVAELALGWLGIKETIIETSKA